VTPPDVEQPQIRDTTPKLQDVIAAISSNLRDHKYQEFEEFLTKYRDISAMKRDDYGRTDRVYNRIDKGEA
jgi:hypothetical protein